MAINIVTPMYVEVACRLPGGYGYCHTDSVNARATLRVAALQAFVMMGILIEY